MDINKFNFVANNNVTTVKTEPVKASGESGEVQTNLSETEEVQSVEKSNSSDQGKKAKVTEKDLHNFVDKANKGLFTNSNHLEFSVHKTTNEIMVKIVDNDTKQVIREIPPESIVDLVAKLCEMAGILVDVKK